jgi:hypothetical protein
MPPIHGGLGKKSESTQTTLHIQDGFNQWPEYSSAIENLLIDSTADNSTKATLWAANASNY